VRDVSRLRAAKIRPPTPPLQVIPHFETIFFRIPSCLDSGAVDNCLTDRALPYRTA
jgi:hypothetical protein